MSFVNIIALLPRSCRSVIVLINEHDDDDDGVGIHTASVLASVSKATARPQTLMPLGIAGVEKPMVF